MPLCSEAQRRIGALASPSAAGDWTAGGRLGRARVCSCRSLPNGHADTERQSTLVASERGELPLLTWPRCATGGPDEFAISVTPTAFPASSAVAIPVRASLTRTGSGSSEPPDSAEGFVAWGISVAGAVAASESNSGACPGTALVAASGAALRAGRRRSLGSRCDLECGRSLGCWCRSDFSCRGRRAPLCRRGDDFRVGLRPQAAIEQGRADQEQQDGDDHE